jgi:hypothetical protein
LREKSFGVLHGVEEIEVLSILVRLEVQVVEQLHQALVELCYLNVAGTRFNFSLDYRYLTVLLGK